MKTSACVALAGLLLLCGCMSSEVYTHCSNDCSRHYKGDTYRICKRACARYARNFETTEYNVSIAAITTNKEDL